MMNNFRGIRGYFFYLYLKELFPKVALDGGAKSTVDSLRMPVFLNFVFALPPITEQDRIIGYLKEKTEIIDLLIKEAEDTILLMQEHRASLISEAVTGKIDVRKYA